jgi:serine/threonine protein kinase
MWSAGCCVYELFTGSPLFPGDDNNDMLWRFQVRRQQRRGC